MYYALIRAIRTENLNLKFKIKLKSFYFTADSTHGRVALLVCDFMAQIEVRV